jgi:dihydrofolate reductase
MVKVGMIWAQSVNGVIGVDNKLPWRLSEDLKHFSETTKGSTVIMGKNTWLSLPAKFRPLVERENFILSRTGFEAEGAKTFSTIQESLTSVETEWAWVIGGSQIYETFINLADKLEVTIVNLSHVEGDAFAPTIPNSFSLNESDIELDWKKSVTGIEYKFQTYSKV